MEKNENKMLTKIKNKKISTIVFIILLIIICGIIFIFQMELEQEIFLVEKV